MTSLPLDLVEDIAVYLETEDLVTATAVSKGWRYVLTELNRTRQLWQNPHFVVYGTAAAGQVPSLGPNPELVIRYLRTLPMLSLRISGCYQDSWDPYYLESAKLSHLAESLKTMAKLVSAAVKGRRIPVTLDNMSTAQVSMCANFARYSLPISKLTIGTLAGSYQSLTVPKRLITEHRRSSTLAPLEIHPSSLPVTTRPMLTPTSKPPEFKMETWRNVDSLLFTNIGTFSKSLSLVVPESMRLSWIKSTHTRLILAGYQVCKISGGVWHIDRQNSDPLIECLRLVNLWSFWCDDNLSSITFNRLVSVRLSFSAGGRMKLRAIQAFLSYVIGDRLEILHLEFPAQYPTEGQHNGINTIWTNKIRRALRLQDVRLVNYIPATLNILTSTPAISANLRKLVLANETPPPGFLHDFVPESLPNLQVLAIYRPGKYPNSTLAERQAWIQRWQNAGISSFRLTNSNWVPPAENMRFEEL